MGKKAQQRRGYVDDKNERKAFEVVFLVKVDGRLEVQSTTNLQDVRMEMHGGGPDGHLFTVKGHFKDPGPRIVLPN